MFRRFHQFGAAIVLAAFVTATAPAHAADFLKAIEDVPLPKGVSEQGEPLVFDSDQGRVVKSTAEGHVGGSEISSFYKTSLPALGWTLVDDPNSLVFERETERLTILMREPASAKPVTVTFELVVKIASTKLPQ